MLTSYELCWNPSLGRESGYRVRKISMCVNCWGTGIGWYKCAHGS